MSDSGTPLPPFIVAGMHRSGTTLLARLLSACGVWLGGDKESRYLESLFFLETNEALLALGDSSWHQPRPFLQSLQTRQGLRSYCDLAAGACRSKLAARYLGLNRWGDGDLSAQSRPWGWKDPRNSLTLPVWLQVFSGARVIHVVRNGLDVASSLVLREKRSRDADSRDSHWLRGARALDRLFGRRPPGWDPGQEGLEKAFQLWCTYLDALLSVTEDLPGNRCLTVQFEKLVEEPGEEARRLFRFLSLPLPDEKLEIFCRSLRRDRSRAFLKSPELVHFFERHRTHPLMRRFGYDEAAC